MWDFQNRKIFMQKFICLMGLKIYTVKEVRSTASCMDC